MVKPPVPPRAWQRMLSGRRLDLLDPSPLDVEIEDIAHGLARVARWNGQTRGMHSFSVAQHCLLVEAIAGHLNPDWPRDWRLMALLHDAPEYVIGDMISPFKAVMGDAYKGVELRLLAAIQRRAGLTPVRNSIRGGTDGSRLSFMGLPCPNIFAGEHAFHSRLEWVSVQDMEAAVRTIVHLAMVWEERA